MSLLQGTEHTVMTVNIPVQKNTYRIVVSEVVDVSIHKSIKNWLFCLSR